MLTHPLGTDVEKLFNYVNDFYVKNRQERHSVTELLQLEAPEQGRETAESNARESSQQAESASIIVLAATPHKTSEFWGTPNVKEEFQEYVWNLLRQETDFRVGPKNESRDMSLEEIVDKWRDNKQDEKLRVYASEDRRWRALTGHGPDPKKVCIPHLVDWNE